MNIYVTRKIPELGIKMLEERGYNVEVGKSQVPLTKEDLLELASKQKYDAFLTLLTDSIDEDFIKAAGSKLKIISNIHLLKY